MNFKEWLLLTEVKKSSDISKELLGNNESLFKQIKSIIPTDAKQDLQAIKDYLIQYREEAWEDYHSSKGRSI